jgi:phospholipase/carboxylesterase
VIDAYVSGGTVVAGKPVLLLLHGYGSNEQDLPSLVNYLPGSLPWFSLRAPLKLQPGSYAWAHRAVPGNPQPETVEAGTSDLWAWIDANLPESCPLIALGFSQGGLMVTQMLRTRPDRLLGSAIIAGFTFNATQPADEQLSQELPAVIYCRGLDDQVISEDAVARTLEWLENHTAASVKTYYRLGHSIDERVMDDVAEYFTKTLGIR